MVLCFSMEDLSFVPDLPSGPLDKFRKSSSFDWKRLKLALEGDIELLKLKVSDRSEVIFINITQYL